MVGHEDPEGEVVRAPDGFLAVRAKAPQAAQAPVVAEEPTDAPDVEDSDWTTMTKKELIELAKSQGIELDTSLKIKDLREQYSQKLAEL